MALPTKGRVIIDTTVGELDIELWSKETPKTCRNFLALAMEGYYDGVIFHRVVPDFLVQTGDKTGTGAGGESFYGEPFEDEIHPRLRYAHRGLVGMANNGTKDSNDSQFFITLDRADELNGKHTLFGRCMGDTIFNVMKIGGMELDENGRPLYPPKIKTVRIVENPFDDIVPRITAAEKRAQQRAREQAQREREEEIRRRGAKKDTKLLSFQDDEEQEEEPVVFKKKAIVRPDLVDNADQVAVRLDPDFIAAPNKSSKTKEVRIQKESEATTNEKEKPEKVKNADSDIVGLREKHAKELAASGSEQQKKIQKLENDIRKLTEKRVGGYNSDEELQKKKPKRSHLEEELAKYEKLRGAKKKDAKGKKARDEDDVLARMNAFKTKLKQTTVDSGGEEESSRAGQGGEGEGEQDSKTADSGVALNDDPGMEVDTDTGFLSHKLYFPKDNSEEVAKAERDYEVIDPRQRSARAREEERARKSKMKPRDGGRGHRR